MRTNDAGVPIVGHCENCGLDYVAVDFARKPECVRCHQKQIVPEPPDCGDGI